MGPKKIVFYLPEGFADWEGAFLMAELTEARQEFLTVSETGKAIKSHGGLKVQPDKALADCELSEIEMLILIGSDSWQDSAQNQVAISMVRKLIKQGTYVAAICGAATALARAGELNNRPHTSNELGMLKEMVPLNLLLKF